MKVSWNDLTAEEKALMPNVAGSGAFTPVVQWVFNAIGLQFNDYVYSIHDFQFARGGGVKDFLRSNTYMLLLMQCDSLKQSHFFKGILLYFVIAPIGWVAVSTVGAFFFNFGRYRTKEEILQEFIDHYQHENH